MTDPRTDIRPQHVSLAGDPVAAGPTARVTALRGEVNDAFARPTNIRLALQACAEALVSHVDAALARIWTMERGDILELQANAADHLQLEGELSPAHVESLIGTIAAASFPYTTNNVTADSHFEDKTLLEREGITSLAAYPLLADGRVRGLVAIYTRRALTSETVHAIEWVAPTIVHGIERKRSEEKLRRSEAYLAEGQRLAHTGSWAWTLATGELYLSREWYRIYGFEPAERPPPYEAILARAHPEDAPIVDQALAEAFRDGTELRLLTRILVPGEPMKWVKTYGHPVRNEEGALVEFVGTVVDVTQRRRAAKRLRRAIEARFDAVLAERARIARDMHDGLLQDLTGLTLQLGALLPHVRSNPDRAADQLAEILALSQRTSIAARSAVAGIREPSTSTDLVEAIQHAARRVLRDAPLILSIRVSGPPRDVPASMRDLAVSVVHEAMTNVLKHAEARSVAVLIRHRARTCRVSVRDDGVGIAFAVEGDSPHLGLLGLRERTATTGASLSIRSIPGQGTSVTLDIPYQR